MKKAIFLTGLALVAVFIPFLANADSAVPYIEKEWQLVSSKEWRMGNPAVGSFIIGTNSLYRSPQGDKYGTTLLFVGGNEVILRAWWQGGERPADIGKVEFAVKDGKGDWLSGISGQGIRFDAEIDENGNIFVLYVILNVPAGGHPAGTVIREILFNPPLQSEK